MADSSIKGIAVEIRGDYRQLQADMREARKEVKASAEGMSNALNNALSPRQIESSVMSLTSNLKKIKSATSLAGDEFKNIGADLQSMRAQLGLSEKSFANLQSRILQTKVANVNSSAIQDIAKSANLGVVATASLQRQLGDTTGAFKTLSAGGVASFNRIKGEVVSVKSLIAGLAVGASFKSIFSAGRDNAARVRAFEQIAGSAEEARAELKFLQETSDDLGQDFYSLADSYKGYYAAAKQAGMETQTLRDIFVSITSAGASMGLSTDQIGGALVAVQQMISKGKVSAEELRQQLGERLPGAFGLAAEAMGMTTAELDKMMSSGKLTAMDLLPKLATLLKSRFSGGADKATAALNKFNEGWTRAKLTMADSGFLDAAVSSMQEINKYLESDSAQTNLQNLGVGFANLASGAASTAVAMGKIASILSSLPPELLGALAGAAVGGRLGGGWGALGGAAIGVGAGVGYRQDKSTQAQVSANNAIKASIEAVTKAREKDAAIMSGGASSGVLVGNGGLDLSKLVGGSSASGIDTTTKSYQTAISKINDELAKLTMTEAEYRSYESEKRMGEYAAAVGAANPQLQKLVDLESQRIKNLNRYSTADYANLSAIPDQRIAFLQGKKEADDRAEEEAKKTAQKNLQVQTEFSREYIRVIKGETAAKLEEIDRQAAAYIEAGSNEVAVAQWAAQEKQNISRNWHDGAIRNLQDYADSATNAAENVGSAFADAMGGMEDALTNFVTKGKLDFNDLTNSIINDIARITIRQSITGPLASGFSSFLGSFFHGGGVIGQDAPTFTRSVNPMVFAGAPRFHTGLLPDEFPAILQDGETVIPKGGFKTASGQQQPQSVVNVYNNAGADVSVNQYQDSQGQMNIDVMLDRKVAKLVNKPGSATRRAAGVQQQLVSRR